MSANVKLLFQFDIRSKLTLALWPEFKNFKNLETQICSNNSLKAIDISKNVKLKLLDCNNNDLRFLDASANTSLETLNIDENQIESVKTANCTSLKELRCY